MRAARILLALGCLPLIDAFLEHAPLLPNPRIRRLFHLHARKAGGTSLGSWLARVAKEHRLAFEKNDTFEGPIMPKDFKKRDDTLYFTSLRDPVSRAQSSYVYEGRWAARYGNRTATNGRNFSKWIEDSRCHAQPRPTPAHRKNRVWGCSTNCFAKWLSGVEDAPTCKAEGTALPQSAMRDALTSLMKFDLVVCDASLRDPHYREYIRRRLNTTHEFSQVDAPLSQFAYLWEVRLPPVYPPGEMARLQRLNKMDCSLIRSASAALCPAPRPAAHHGPAKTKPGDHTTEGFGIYAPLHTAISDLYKKHGPDGPGGVTAVELARVTDELREKARTTTRHSRHDLCDGVSVGYRR
jgi:hypothetical protein